MEVGKAGLLPPPPTGSRLLSADADGQIKCWSMADHLANSWESHVGSLVEGDPIVALSWLHNGVKLALHVEKVGVLPEQVGAVGEIIHPVYLSAPLDVAPPLPPPASFRFSSPGPNSCLQSSCQYLRLKGATHLTDGHCPQSTFHLTDGHCPQ